MSYNSVSLSNPDINQGSQLARRQAEGLEDIYVLQSSGDITKREENPDDVDLTDEVTRRVDPSKLPLDPIGEHEDYKVVDGKNYRVRYEDVGGGKKIPYLQQVEGRGQYSDTKMVLIGGKVYEVEFEKDPETKRISTYVTSSVGELFQNDRFLADHSPAQKLALLGKIRKAATYSTWYDSGEYNRYHREKYDGEENPELDPAKVRQYDFDPEAKKIQAKLEKDAAVDNATPLPSNLQEIGAGMAMGSVLGIGVAYYMSEFAAKRSPAPKTHRKAG